MFKDEDVVIAPPGVFHFQLEDNVAWLDNFYQTGPYWVLYPEPSDAPYALMVRCHRVHIALEAQHDT